MSFLNILPIYPNLKIDAEFLLLNFKIEDCYINSYEKLIRRFGEVQALELVYHIQSLSKKLSYCPNHYIHTCELLTTFWECNKAKQTFLNRQCSISRLPNTNHDKNDSLFLWQVLKLIQGPELAEMTAKLRRLTDVKEREQYLINHFCYAYFPFTYTTRFETKVVRQSSLICIHIDGLGERLSEIRTFVNSLPLMVMSFRSPDGNGLRVIFEMNSSSLSHEEYFRYYSTYIRKQGQLASIDIDECHFNNSRLCYFSHDPDLYVNQILFV